MAGNQSSLSEQLGEGEIELRNELLGGEVHAAWHLRYAGRDFSSNVMKGNCFPVLPPKPTNWSYCRSKTVTVPKVWAVGADRDYSFGDGLSPTSPAGCA
ncbi:hypothetical protein DMI70_25815 [Escherichia coli]|nr:hypothetical protein [Escherichia coli]